MRIAVCLWSSKYPEISGIPAYVPYPITFRAHPRFNCLLNDREGVGGDGARGYAEGGTRADPQTLSGAVLGGSVSVSKVAVAAGELLQVTVNRFRIASVVSRTCV